MKLFLLALALTPLLTGCLTSSLAKVVGAAGKSWNGQTNHCTLHIHSPVYGDLTFTWNADPATAATSPFFNPAQGTPVLILPPNVAMLPTPEGGVVLHPKPGYRQPQPTPPTPP